MFTFLFRGFPRRFAPRNDTIWSVAITATPFELSACAQGALHQADNLAKLWQEFLSLLELIAQILCAVEKQKTSKALGDTQILSISVALAMIFALVKHIPTAICLRRAR